MGNSFRRNVEVLFAETKSDALVRLKRCNSEYAKKVFRWSDLNEALYEFFENDNAELTFKQKSMMKEFMKLESEIRNSEQSTVYIQGYFDCICLMKDFGLVI